MGILLKRQCDKRLIPRGIGVAFKILVGFVSLNVGAANERSGCVLFSFKMTLKNIIIYYNLNINVLHFNLPLNRGHKIL